MLQNDTGNSPATRTLRLLIRFEKFLEELSAMDHYSFVKCLSAEEPQPAYQELIMDSEKMENLKDFSITNIYLDSLSLIDCGLKSLEGFPYLPKLKRLKLNDNKLSRGLKILLNSPNLVHLSLCGNRIESMEELEPLKELQYLKSLDLYKNEVTSTENYRENVFALIPTLISLDGMDKNGNETDDESDTDMEQDTDESDDGQKIDVLSEELMELVFF